jgi:hypothetical protein
VFYQPGADGRVSALRRRLRATDAAKTSETV